MIKQLIAFIFLFFSVHFSQATILSGNINSNQTLTGKIDIINDVNVASNVTLTFSEGCALVLTEGASIKGAAGSHIIFAGTTNDPISINPAVQGTFWGELTVEGAGAGIELHHVSLQGGHIRILNGADGLIEDSYLRDYYKGSIPIVYAGDAAEVQLRRCMVTNYYEVNFARTLTIIEDCIFQFMTGDGIDMDNSPAGTTIQRTTVRFGRGTNIDAIDFGKVNFSGNGSIGLVQRCLIHDISDKGISIGEGAQEITAEGNLIYHCGAGIAVKDNSYARIYNNTIVENEEGIGLVEKNPGLGGGNGYTYNNILWDNTPSFYLNSNATVEIRYSDVQDMLPDSSLFNISSNPLFINPSVNDFRLRESSPAIASGFNNETMGAIFPVGAMIQSKATLVLGIPNSFSSYSADEYVSITWSVDSAITNLKILFSEDGGANWQTLASGIDAQSREYLWQVPDIYSTNCKIKLIAESNPAIQTENYLPFQILPEENDSFSPDFSLPAGYYNSEQQLSLSSQTGDIIYYSLDGSDPSDQSMVYSGPISLTYDSIPAGQAEQNITATNRAHQPYSYIRTAPVSQIGPNPAFWYLPSGTIFKAHVINARIYRPGLGLGPIVTKSYFIDPDMLNNRYTLPVISLVSDPKNLFDYYDGIYIPGADFTGYSFTGNYERKGRVSEKPAHFEFFDTDGRLEISKNIGFRVRGEWIRSMGQKALTIYARSEYDEQNKFAYELFPGLMKPGTKTPQTLFKRFILRNAGNEWGWNVNSMCRDMLNQSLFDRLDVKYQAGRPSIVFLNGEYWGIENIRELNDKRGLQYSYGVDPDSVIMMEDNLVGPFQLVTGNDGDMQEYHTMRNFIMNNNLADAQNFSAVKEMMDVENFTDYWIATIYSNKKNTDHNTSYWKLRNGHPGPGVRDVFDGRWRWMANDFDNGFDVASNNNLSLMVWLMKDSLLKHMLTSPEFNQGFLNRFADLLNSSFSTSHVLKRLDYYHQILEPEMPEHIARWRTPLDMANWEQAMNNFRVFAEDRPAYQFGHLLSWFGIASTHEMEVDVNDQIMGNIQVNSLRINQSLPGVAASVYPWSGKYFESVPVTITAIPFSGYRFREWKESEETSSSISVYMHSDMKRTAVFEPDPSQYAALSDIYPNPVRGAQIHFVIPCTVVVFNAEGKEVLRRNDPVISLDISSLSSGIYFVRLNDTERVKLVKL